MGGLAQGGDTDTLGTGWHDNTDLACFAHLLDAIIGVTPSA